MNQHALYHQSKSGYAPAVLAMVLIEFVEAVRIEQLDTYLGYFCNRTYTEKHGQE